VAKRDFVDKIGRKFGIENKCLEMMKTVFFG